MLNAQSGVEGLSPLPMAENLDADLLIKNGYRLSERPNVLEFVPSLHRRLNRLEIGLCLKGSQVLEKVFNELVEVAEDRDYDLVNRDSVALRATQMFEKGFWYRLYDKPMDEAALDELYGNVTTLLCELPVNKHVSDYRGVLPELLVSGALLRRRDASCVPYIVSPRESSYGNEKTNHNLGVLLTDNEGNITKRPVQVIAQHAFRTARHPMVARINVGRLAMPIFRQHPDVRQRIRPEESLPYTENTAWTMVQSLFLKDLMIRETNKGSHSLDPGELAILNTFSSVIHSCLNVEALDTPERARSLL